MNHWIQTFTGKQFYPLQPRIEDIDIMDIAHHLSNQCRFSGACKTFYSVAEHSVRVAWVVGGTRPEKLAALLHDASEAYLTDVSTPVKCQLPAYQEAEKVLEAMIYKRFGLECTEVPRSAKHADAMLLATEKRDLMGPEPAPWSDIQGPLPKRIMPWTSEVAKTNFLGFFTALTQKTVKIPIVKDVNDLLFEI